MAGLFKRETGLDQVIAIDLGGRTTKAVHIQRKGDSFLLQRYALVDAPIFEKNISVDLLGEHLKTVVQGLEARSKNVIVGISANDSLIRVTDVPMMPISDLRLMLKLNSKNYLQQDLPDYVFDAYALPARISTPSPGEKPKPSALQKQRVLVGGAKRNLVNDLQASVKAAGLIPHSIVPSIIGPVNAFELAHPDIFAKEIVALVDIGFKNSTITIIQDGELALNRVVSGGGDKLTSGLAESLGISYAEAESIKIKLMSEVEVNMEPLLSPLGRELKASIDFFEHQQDKTIGQVYFSGASTRSEFIVKTLQNSLYVPCQTWNPTAFTTPMLPPQQMGELEQVAPQLAVVMGLAATAF